MKIYLAGPIGGVSTRRALLWRKIATGCLKRAGIEALDPCREKDLVRWHEDKSIYDPREVVMRDLRDIEECDALLVDAGQNVAMWGTPAEAFYAWQLGKPLVIWGVKGDAPLWLQCYTQDGGRIFETLHDALEYIIWGWTE